MATIDKNKVFFGLIHYILSEQKNVDWILKTSLVDFTGVSSLLEEKSYIQDSLLDNIIDYIMQIKPYHVQFSRYFERYQTATEKAVIPKFDKLETTIKQRFDAIKSSPDIQKIFYRNIDILPKKDDKEANEIYNKKNIVVYAKGENKKQKQFWLREFNNNVWSWKALSDTLYDGIYYTTYDNKYYAAKNNVLDENLFNKEEFINSHKANRLFYMGIHDLDELKKELNANFKGLEINGGALDNPTFGYDISDYELSDYDTPTIIYDYCIYDYNENLDMFNKSTSYMSEKVPVKILENTFTIPAEYKSYQSRGKTIHVYRLKNGVLPVGSNIKDFETPNFNLQFSDYSNAIQLYEPIKKFEKIFITLENNKTVEYIYTIEGYAYQESSSDTLKRTLIAWIDSGQYYLPIPEKETNTNRIVVQIEDTTGVKKKFLNYTIDNVSNSIVIPYGSLKPNEHISITAFDYKYLYDKIYNWEDKFGRSNNVINLSGDKFLRAIYEKDRPSELVVSSPQSSLLSYILTDSTCSILHNDYKNNLHAVTIDNNDSMIITNLTYNKNSGIKTVIETITLNTTTPLSDAPGKIIVNSEIIKYNSIDRTTNTLSGLSRGTDGSIVYTLLNPKYYPKKLTHTIGDIVRPYIKDDWETVNKNYYYINYNISDDKQLTFDCPFGKTESSTLRVMRLPKINLLNDITKKSTEIVVDSYNFLTFYEQKELENNKEISFKDDDTNHLNIKINDITIPFKKIAIEGNKIVITKFNLPIDFNEIKAEDAFVHSSLPEEITKFKSSLVKDVKYDIKDNYIISPTHKEHKLYYISGSSLLDMSNQEVGYIVNNTAYNLDGTIFGLIVGNNFYIAHTAVTFSPNVLKKGESIHIILQN